MNQAIAIVQPDQMKDIHLATDAEGRVFIASSNSAYAFVELVGSPGTNSEALRTFGERLVAAYNVRAVSAQDEMAVLAQCGGLLEKSKFV